MQSVSYLVSAKIKESPSKSKVRISCHVYCSKLVEVFTILCSNGHDIYWRYLDGKYVHSVTDLTNIGTSYFGEAVPSGCWQYAARKLAICTSYTPMQCGIWDPVTLRNISAVVDVDTIYDPMVGQMMLMRNEKEKYLVNCYYTLTNVACDILDIGNDFKVVLKGQSVFDRDCCGQELKFVTATDNKFLISATNQHPSDPVDNETSTVYSCTVHF